MLAVKSAVIAAVGAKTATGLVFALAVGGGGAIVATKTTHSSNPAVWTRHVVDAVHGVSPSATPALGRGDAGVITGPTPAPTPGDGGQPINGQSAAPDQTGATPDATKKPKKPKKKDATPSPTTTSDGYADPPASDEPQKPKKGTPPPGD